jgi:hypothetical protein
MGEILKMVICNLRDENILENVKAVEELKKTGLFTDDELQELYDKQVESDKRKENDNG